MSNVTSGQGWQPDLQHHRGTGPRVWRGTKLRRAEQRAAASLCRGIDVTVTVSTVLLGVLTLVSVDVNLTVFPTLRRQFPAELRYGYSKYCLARRTDIGVSRCQLDSFPHITLGFRSGTAPITTTEKTTGTSRHGNIANICSYLCVCVCVCVCKLQLRRFIGSVTAENLKP